MLSLYQNLVQPPKKKRKTEKADKPKEMTPVAKEKQKGKDTSKGKTKENKISDKKKSPKKKEPVAVKIATPLKKQSPKKKPPKGKHNIFLFYANVQTW